MNIHTINKITKLFSSLPQFEHYGFYNEPIEDVTFHNGRLNYIKFPMGSLSLGEFTIETDKEGCKTSPSEVQCWTLALSTGEVQAQFIIR